MIVIDSGPSKRSLIVLAVGVGCFAVLWPKIFYPMIQSILFPFDEDEADILNDIQRLDFQKMLHPQMREAMGEARPVEKITRDGSQIPFHPSVSYTVKPPSKDAGVANLVIPMYTIAIIVFFIYSLFKTVLKKQGDICHPHVVNENRTYVHQCSEIENASNKRKDMTQERKAQRALEQYGKDKVLTALKTIILEMEDFKGTIDESNVNFQHVSDLLHHCASRI
ncbi:resistance to inhibitors of cholinesterase protein 3-like [Uloborus diversus]|uniref:resistance to inhibitors of cholinesterase protein 3-like n=1 Tax=Uloborus diversus TaxID=327109 RepID=UPI0024095FFA|nr:resistance to inhibitors of cholinesterase protein 3-like [Uloborus diversus]